MEQGEFSTQCMVKMMCSKRGGEHIVNPLVRVPVMEPEVPVREQVDVVLPGVEVPVPEVRRSSRVRKEMRNTDYHYY